VTCDSLLTAVVEGNDLLLHLNLHVVQLDPFEHHVRLPLSLFVLHQMEELILLVIR
jgi:hypothetical protein